MNNFYLRIISSLIIAPIFFYGLYELSFFYILLIVVFLLAYYEVFKNVKQKKIKIFLYLLIFFFIWSLFKVRNSDYDHYINLIWILSIVMISDIFGYIVGKLIGGAKLSIYSPNKTISGFLGSIIFSQFAILIPIFFLNNFIINFKVFLLQFILCLISIFGDIFFSYVKRLNKIKDYSALIPGHGGVLDRIDGMVFVIIAYNFILMINEI